MHFSLIRNSESSSDKNRRIDLRGVTGAGFAFLLLACIS